MNKALLAPFSLLYGFAVSLRHKMFDWGILRSQEHDIPVVCVGNLTVGGTGKTPVCEFIISAMENSFKPALLSRGYRRRTKGYLEVLQQTPFLDCGDEPKQIKMKYPEIVVAVCENRNQGIHKIREEHPQVNMIIMDDGFQHRYVEPWVNIVLMDYNRPVYRDHLLPRGSLRDKPSQLHRAHYVLVTKCPPGLSPLDRRLVRKSLGLYPYQNLYFCGTESGQPVAIFPEGEGKSPAPGTKVVAMSAIGNPGGFHASVSQYYTIVDEIVFPDHHPYRRRDLQTMEHTLEAAGADSVILTTEKDAVKLMNSKKIPSSLKEKLYYLPIRITFEQDSAEDFLQKLNQDVRTNPKNSLIHS